MPFPPVFNLGNLDGSNGFTIKGQVPDATVGSSISGIGDVNGDGFDDFMIAAPPVSLNGNPNSGVSFVLFGSGSPFAPNFDLSTWDGSNGFFILGQDTDDFSGYSVSGAGDVNGDGIDDFLIGTPYGDPNSTDDAGEVYVIFGSSTGFPAAFELSSLDGTNGFVINGENSSEAFGAVISEAGDVNGDGFDDILIGAHNAGPNGNLRAGESYVVFGSGAGFSATLDISSLDGSNGFVISGTAQSDHSGYAISDAGDFNGDGYDDLIIGALGGDPYGMPNALDAGQVNAGLTYMLFGTGEGFPATFNLSDVNGTNGFIINGIMQSDESGYAVAGIGDFNGDGFDDVLIGAPYADPNGNNTAGESYVVFGSAATFPLQFDLASLDGTNGFKIPGIAAFDYSGASVASAGDVNGDGYDDLMIGARAADPFGVVGEAGQTYILFGNSTGWTGTFDLSTLDGSNGFVLNGKDAEDYSGYEISGAGDINGDGVDDFLIGAFGADPGGLNQAGETYVVFGIAPPGPTTGVDTLAGNALANSVTFEATTLNNGDSYDGQGGNDTVQLAGGGTFDFTGVTLTNVEAISTDGTDSTLHFTDQSYLALLTSLGGANDRVEVEGFSTGYPNLASLFDVFDLGAEQLGFSVPGFAVEGTYDSGSDVVTLVYTDSSGDGSGSIYSTQTRTIDRDGVTREWVNEYDNGRVSTNNYNSDGHRTGYTIDLPNGSSISATLDPATGKLLTQSSTRADGLHAWTSFDLGIPTERIFTDTEDAFTFQLRTYRYEPGGGLNYTARIDDNGNQYAFGYAGSQTFQDTAGGDTFHGGAGDDLFVFDDAMGIDRIADFEQGDLIDLTAIGIESRDDLDAIPGAIYQQGSHVVIDYSVIDPNHSGLLYLFNTDLSDVDNSDFAGSAS